jgi:hypothetical protein
MVPGDPRRLFVAAWGAALAAGVIYTWPVSALVLVVACVESQHVSVGARG